MNTKSNHTPGPWTNSGLMVHAMVGNTPGMAVLAKAIRKIGPIDRGYEQSIANARLIAAAPELLEALEAVLKAIGPYDSGLPVEQIKAAIKKARGE